MERAPVERFGLAGGEPEAAQCVDRELSGCSALEQQYFATVLATGRKEADEDAVAGGLEDQRLGRRSRVAVGEPGADLIGQSPGGLPATRSNSSCVSVSAWPRIAGESMADT